MNRIQTRSLRSFRLAGRHSLLKGPRRRTPNPTRIVEPTSVFLGLKQRYEVLWNFLSMDDSRHLIDGIKKDAINTSVHPELLKDASVREGRQLSIEEIEFVKVRKAFQKHAFAKYIGVDPKNIDERDIPIVGIASSGGGYRAMIGLLGYIKAMKKTEIWDCIMYLAGVSGSCWTIATYYSSVSQTCPSRLERHFESKLNIHWANLSNFFNQLICTPQHSRVMLQGIIQRAYQRGGDLSFADIFGTLIGSTLLLPAITEPSKQQLGCNYLSKQSQYLSDGLEPMPIYSSVYHTEEEYDSYQWFEFTPYEMGCEDIEAWIPTWAFGRRFEQGTSKDRLTEQSMDTMLGMFGSAFTARVIRVYEEIRSFLPLTSITKLDNVVSKYERSISKYHPISPLGFPNPFYGLAPDENKRTDSFISSKDLCLIDAGVDNNIPFYPLLRQERGIDIIFAIDLSSDIQTTSHFDRAETYIKHRRMKGWPKGAGWPKQSGPSEKYPLGPCTIFSDNDRSDVSLVYFPFIGNSSYDPGFDPQTEEFCKTWNFVYEPDQIHKLIGLADANWRESENQIRVLLKETWERKMKKRQMMK